MAHFKKLRAPWRNPMDTTKALGFQVPPWLQALLQAWALLNTAPSRSLFTNKCGDFGDGIGWKLLKLMLKTDWTVLKMVEKSWKMAVKLLKIPRRMQKDVTSIMYIHAVSINVQNNSWQKSAASVEVAIVCLKILSGCFFIFFHLPMANSDNYDNWLGCNSQTVRLSMNALCCSIRYTGYTYTDYANWPGDRLAPRGLRSASRIFVTVPSASGSCGSWSGDLMALDGSGSLDVT